MKNLIKQTKNSLFMLTIAGIVVILFSACRKDCYDCDCNEYVTETVSITEQIKGIIIEGPWNVSITQEDTDNSAVLKYCACKKVKVTAQQLPNGYVKIKLTTRNVSIHHNDFQATIKASFLEKIEGSGATTIRTYGHFCSFNEIELSGASTINGLSSEGHIAKIRLSGASSLKEFTFEGQKIDAILSGASIAKIDNLTVENCTIDCSGASSFNGNGYAAKTSFNGSGASTLKTLDLESENLDIDLSGASSAEVAVNNTIKGNLAGASILKYKRAIDVSRVHVDASSRIIKLN